MAGGPLSGVKVIELAHIMAGPVCGMMLADMGADVIKVDKPTGDDTCRMVPPEIGGEAAAYMMMNRNKRGIALNLKEPEALEALRKLLSDADVVVENYRTRSNIRRRRSRFLVRHPVWGNIPEKC